MRVKEFRVGESLEVPCLMYVNAPWCPHCQATTPIIKDCATRLGSALQVVSVNGDKHPALCKRFGVQGYPTILFLDSSGRRSEYTGARSAKAIADWACQQSGRCGF